MIELVLSVLGVVCVLLAGINLRAIGNNLIFAVSVMGKHGDMRRLGLNSLIYWLGTLSILGPAIFAMWEFSSYLLSLSGYELRFAAYLVSTVFLIWAIFNFYVYKVGPRRDSEGRLRSRIVSLSRSSGKLGNDVIFGILNGVSILASEFGILLGGIWLIQSAGGFGYAELAVVVAGSTLAIWAIFGALLYGLNLSAIERFRKAHGSKVSFICGVCGVLGSWLIIATTLGVL